MTLTLGTKKFINILVATEKHNILYVRYWWTRNKTLLLVHGKIVYRISMLAQIISYSWIKYICQQDKNICRIHTEHAKVHLLQEFSVKLLHHARVNEYTTNSPVNLNVNTEWKGYNISSYRRPREKKYKSTCIA